MRFSAKSPDGGTGHDRGQALVHEVDDPVLDEALRNFRSSVHAWSEAVYSQPRQAVPVHTVSWHRVSAWALALVLAVGAALGGLYEHSYRQAQARIAAAEAARRQKAAEPQPAASEKSGETLAAVAAGETAKSDSEELAKVDSDVSREVPSAMEPLAQMMNVDESE